MFSVAPGAPGGIPSFDFSSIPTSPASLPPVDTRPAPYPVTHNLEAWNEVKELASAGAAQTAFGELSMHSQAARDEAVRKVLSNHENLLKDVCNPSPTQNIVGNPLTQLELVRVPAEMAPHVDQGLREATRMMLGLGVPFALNASPDACEARAAAARYLHIRIQANIGEMPSRAPDMSPEAKAAMMAALVEVGDTRWEYLKEGVKNAGSGPAADAARKLISNHFRVVVDVCNPRGQLAISGITLTQTELKRVPASSATHVDAALREVARRLINAGSGPETLDDTFVGRIARKTMAEYLEGRTQSTYSVQPTNQHKMRKGDMSQEAADVFKATVNDVAAGILPSNSQVQSSGLAAPSAGLSSANAGWGDLEKMMLVGASESTQGAASNFSLTARQEAAQKIVGNHVRLIKDVCNPSPGLNIDGKPLTQRNLSRVDPAMQAYVDQGMREVVRRLMGKGKPVMFDTSAAAQDARAAAARYLYCRVQGTPEEKVGRTPDMSSEAKEAFLAVLMEVGDTQWEPLRKLESKIDDACASPGELAARKVVSNHLKLIMDICNPSPVKNIVGFPLTQGELVRIAPKHAVHVDGALREAVRQLMNAVELPPISLDESPDAQRARAMMVTYLEIRIHTELSSPQPAKMRAPDMSFASAQALLGILGSLISGGQAISAAVADGSESVNWLTLEQMLSEGIGPLAIGVAGQHSQAAREEAARKLIGNRANLLKDVCNASTERNIIGNPLTQIELVRVPADMAAYVDQGFREAARRLLGASNMELLDPSPGTVALIRNAPDVPLSTLHFPPPTLPPHLDAHKFPKSRSNPSAEGIEARAAAARYLHFRTQSLPEQMPGRAPDMSPQAKAAFMAVLIEVGDTNWEPLKALVSGGNHEGAEFDAAKKLVSNHFNLLQDICNPRTQLNIIGITLTQADLARVSMKDAQHVDAALRETARLLLGGNMPPVPLDASSVARGARKKMTAYLEARTHSDHSRQPTAQHAHRKPDMSEDAARAFKDTLQEVASMPGVLGGTVEQIAVAPNGGFGGGDGAWGQAAAMLNAGAFSTAVGVASNHQLSARDEAARKLIGNHANLLKDICNPSSTQNIVCIQLTQTELARVDARFSQHVDEGLIECCRRLLGRGFVDVLHTSRAAQAARSACARYLYFRIQSHPEQKPDRKPDMSPAAAAAMKAVLIEVGSMSWEPLKRRLQGGAKSSAFGAANKHSQKARLEAATKLIGNHFNLTIDVCNPSRTQNIVGNPLTQPELARVSPGLGQYVEEELQEVALRLLGGVGELDPSPLARDARAQAARYLYHRIQGVQDQKPGRTPDMSAAAAKAMKAVLIEVGSTAWETLHELAAKGAKPSAMGAAGSFSQAARQEAARKICGNHFNLILDICNPRPDLNIIGVPLTQTELTRVPASDAPFVDQGLREVVRRLLNRGSANQLDDSPKAQEARTTCATYLDTRIQGSPAEKPGRKPDMGAEAASAVKAVLIEVAADMNGVHDVEPTPNAEKLAEDLEKMAAQLKMGGRLTASQIKQVSDQMAQMGDVQTRACTIQ